MRGMKKLLSILLCLCMLAQNVPVAVFAAGDAQCGYVPGVACGHVCGEGCQIETTACVHIHGEDGCSYVEATQTEAAVGECNHTACTVDSGCVKIEKVCIHTVHEDCGYVAGAKCTFDPAACSECADVKEEIFCTCESEDPGEHAPFCDLYVRTYEECKCVLNCAVEGLNPYCETCYFEGVEACGGGEEEMIPYAEAEAEWTVSGESVTGTLAQAVAAAVAGHTSYITLLKDVETNSLNITAGEFTINLNRKTIMGNSGNVFNVTGGKVTLDGNGTIQTIDDITAPYTLRVALSGEVTLKSGTIIGRDAAVVVAKNSTLNVQGNTELKGNNATYGNIGIYHNTSTSTVNLKEYTGEELKIYLNASTVLKAKIPLGSGYGYFINGEQIAESNSAVNNNQVLTVKKVSTTYTVNANANPTEGGTVTGGGSYSEGATVTLTANPAEGYTFKEWQVVSGGVTVENNSFTMPASNVEIKAVFEAVPTAYSITIGAAITNGTVTADKMTAAEGETVTLTVTPEADFVLSTLFYRCGEQVENVTKNADGTYSFVMPAGDVTITASFMYPVYVQGVGVTSQNMNDVLGDGTVSYNKDTNTLTLNGANITGASVNGSSFKYGIYAPNDLNISVGANGAVIHNCNYGIEGNHLLISGGPLVIETATIIGITAQNSITIENADLKVTSASNAIVARLNGEGVVRIHSGRVTAAGGQYGLGGNSVVFGNQCHVVATGNTAAVKASLKLATGATGVSRTNAEAEFVSGLVYDDQKYLEFRGSGASSSYRINCETAQNGSVSADKMTALENETITLTVTPNEGYKLKLLMVDGSNVTTQVVNNQYAFSMPGRNVTVSATFQVIEYPVKVQGVMVTALNKSDVLGNGTVSYDPATFTLALNNASISHESGAAIQSAYPDYTLKIVGTGTNTISATGGSGIYANRQNISISGGTFLVSGSTNGIFAEAGSLTIDGAQVKAVGTNNGAYAKNGITVTNGGGLLAVTGNKAAVRGTYTMGAENFARLAVSEGAKLIVESGKTVTVSDYITSSGVIEIQGTLKVPAGSGKSTMSGGILYIGTKGYRWDAAKNAYVCLEHDWIYRLKTGTTDTVEAHCDECQSTSSDVLTLSKLTREVYNGPGTTEAALNEYNESVFADVGKILYQKKDGGTAIDRPLTDAGTYIASVTVGSGENAVTASVEYTIAPKPVTLTVTLKANTKVYDGTTTAEVDTATAVGVIRADNQVAVQYGEANYNSPNVADAKEVHFTGWGLTGHRSENYILSAQPVSVSATITAKSLEDAAATLSDHVIFNGEPVPELTVKDGDRTLEKDKDYTVVQTGSNGEFTMTITGIGNYKDDVAAKPAYLVVTLPDPDKVEPDDKDAIDAYEYYTDRNKTYKDAELEKTLNALKEALTAYDVIKGHKSSYTKRSGKTFSLTANGYFGKFTGLKVDGKLLDSKYYTAKSGSTIVTLKNSYLDGLSDGKHAIEFLYTDGSTGDGHYFRIATNNGSPITGDNNHIAMFTGIMMTSLLCMVMMFMLVTRKKGKYER